MAPTRTQSPDKHPAVCVLITTLPNCASAIPEATLLLAYGAFCIKPSYWPCHGVVMNGGAKAQNSPTLCHPVSAVYAGPRVRDIARRYSLAVVICIVKMLGSEESRFSLPVLSYLKARPQTPDIHYPSAELQDHNNVARTQSRICTPCRREKPKTTQLRNFLVSVHDVLSLNSCNGPDVMCSANSHNIAVAW